MDGISKHFTGYFLQGKAKWDAWNTKKGMAQDEAKQKYVELAKQLKEKHGLIA